MSTLLMSVVAALMVFGLVLLAAACSAPDDRSSSRHCSGYAVASIACQPHGHGHGHGHRPHPRYTKVVPTANVTKLPGVTPSPVPRYTPPQRVAPKAPAAPRLSLRK
ncbi:hypothetical protein ACIQVL_03295 [Streptomyces sp. NPDC090499]|uniref:hypothetical protein n=1 Tax=Streptomyces sp. NPDC090499 TaxID=3365965 RepID=UPI00382F654B